MKMAPLVPNDGQLRYSFLKTTSTLNKKQHFSSGISAAIKHLMEPNWYSTMSLCPYPARLEQ